MDERDATWGDWPKRRIVSTFPNEFRTEVIFKTSPSLLLDDASADYADDRTVSRIASARTDARHPAFRLELQTVVESVIGASLGAPWIATLRALARGASPMKWNHVKDAILTGFGLDVSSVRDGLAAQVVVVTDPMATARTIDLATATGRPHFFPLGVLLFARKQGARERPSLPPEIARMVDFMRRGTFDDILEGSGLGRLCDHMSQADARDSAGEAAFGWRSRNRMLESFASSLGGSLNKAAKFASKATVLAVPILDPEHPAYVAIERRFEELAGVMRFGGYAGEMAQQALTLVANRRLVVDAGHRDITDLTAKLRDIVELHAKGPWFNDAQQAIDAFTDDHAESPAARGFVRPGDDRQELRLQVADVAAGWAGTLIEQHGYRGLASVFRCVLYNGTPLTTERAMRIDERRRQHDGLLASMAGRWS